MGYSNRFVVNIISNGKTLKELANGQVPLAYGSTYEIKLWNKNYRRASAEVFIDGIRQGTWVLNGGQSFHLKRPSDVDAAFVFTKTDSKEAREQGKSKTEFYNRGLIKVVWKLEREYTPLVVPQVPKVPKKSPPWDYPDYPPYPTKYPWRRHPYPDPYEPLVWWQTHTKDTNSSTYKFVENASYQVENSSEQGVLLSSNSQYSDGVTVRGDETGQTFDTAAFIGEADYTEIKLTLVGYEGPVEELHYCTRCGVKRPQKANFCPSCGLRYPR